MLGRGLWGPVYGNLALEEDFNTVAGSMFGHDKETPGLGAEIENTEFEVQFIGKKIFDENGNFTSIKVLKGACKSPYPRSARPWCRCHFRRHHHQQRGVRNDT